MTVAPDPGVVDDGFACRRYLMGSPGPPPPRWRDATVVRVEGDVDIATVPALRSLLARAGHEAHVLVDLSGVTFMDCSGLSALLQARAHHAGRLALRAPPPSLRRILAALDIESAFTIVDLEEVAVAGTIHVGAPVGLDRAALTRSRGGG